MGEGSGGHRWWASEWWQVSSWSGADRTADSPGEASSWRESSWGPDGGEHKKARTEAAAEAVDPEATKKEGNQDDP